MQKLFFFIFIYSLLPDDLYCAVLDQKVELVISMLHFGTFARLWSD